MKDSHDAGTSPPSVHAVLGLSCVPYCLLKIILCIQQLYIALGCPNRTSDKACVMRSQTPCAIGLQLIANIGALVTGRANDDMHMVRAWINDPQFPLSMLAMLFDGDRNHFAVDFGQQQNVVFQSVSMPLFQSRLRRLFSVLFLSPPSRIALQECAVNRPCNEVTDWLVGEFQGMIPPASEPSVYRHPNAAVSGRTGSDVSAVLALATVW